MAKINISVSSDSSKPRITISKGPVGPQGEQGIQGIQGEQGPEGNVVNLSAIPDVILAENPPAGVGEYPNFGALANNLLVWDVNYNDGNGRWTYFRDATTTPTPVESPPPGKAFVSPVIGENLTNVSSAGFTALSVNNGTIIPNDASLYVNGTSRFNGPVQVAANGVTVYALPVADGSPGQFMKTDGSGVVTFATPSVSDLSDGSSVMTTDTTQVVSGAKLFTSLPSFTNGLTVSNGPLNAFGVTANLGTVVAGGSITTTQLNFASGASTIATAFGTSPEDLEIYSDGNVRIILDHNDDQVSQKFVVSSSDDSERFSVQEDGVVRISNAYNLPSSDGSANYFLKTDGSGQLYFATVDGTSGNTAASPPPPPTYEIDDLTDVDTTTVAPLTGQALVWDGSQWEPGDSFSQGDFDTAFGNKSIDALGDVDTTSAAPSTNDTLVWNGTNWVPGSGSPWTTSGSDIYYTTGNVGVGTATPSEALDVSGNAKVSGSITFGAATISANSVSNNGLLISRFGIGASFANAGVAIGNSVGRFNSGQNNVAIGGSAGYRGSYSNNQIAIGDSSNSGGAAYVKTNSVGVGTNSNYNGGVNTTSVGANTGANSPSSYTNSAFFGYLAGHSGGNNSVFVGYEAGKSDGVQLVNDTVAVGYQALTALTTGTGNTAVGYQAGNSTTVGTNGTFLGYNATAANNINNTTVVGYNAQAFGSNTAVFGNGAKATNGGTALGSGAVSNDYSVSIGQGAVGSMNPLFAGTGVVVGRYAGYSMSGDQNTYIGNSSAQWNTTGAYNVMVGGQAGLGVSGTSTFSNTVAVGYQALTALTTGAGNTAVGYQASDAMTTGSNNTAIGYQALSSFTTGGSTVAVGSYANSDGTSSNSVYIGHAAGRYYSTGDQVVVIGYNAASVSASGQHSIYIGGNAGAQAAGADRSIAIGQSAGYFLGGVENTLLGGGAGSGSGASNYSQTVAVGYQALAVLTTGAQNTAVGYQAGDAITTSTGNTLVGYQAGTAITGSSNAILGNSAGTSLTSGTGNVLVGSYAGNSITTRVNNVAIGNGANVGSSTDYGVAIGGSAVASGGYTTAIGYFAGNGSSGSWNVLNGFNTMRNSSGSFNAVSGGRSMYTTGGSYNAVMGQAAMDGGGSNNNYNVAIGYNAFQNGSNNVIIGANAASASGTLTNKLYIENSNSTTPLIYGEFDNDILRVNGTLQVNDPSSTGYAFPTATGTEGQALVVNANGDVEFGDVGIDGLATTFDPDDVRAWRPEVGGYGVDTSAADDNSLNLGLGESAPRDLYFKPDGTKCYIVGNGLDDIHEVPLATAWDLQSATVANIVDVNLAGSASVGGRGFENNLYGIHIADDPNDSSTYGKKFFIVGSSTDEIQEYTATTAWDASTISTNATAALDIQSQDTYPSALRFTPDGETLYVLDGDNDASPRCRVWDLTTAWDLSTATYNASKDITFPVIDRNARGLDFNSDGTVVYITTISNNVHQYSLSTAYDITTLSYVRSINVSRFRAFIHQPSNNHLNETYNYLEGIFFVKSDSDKYAFLLFNDGDEIIRLDRTGLIQSNDTVFEGLVSAEALNVSGTSLLSHTRFLGGVVMGSPYISGAMNWNGFNSGPIKGATSSHDALTFGSNVKSIGFTNNINQNPDNHDLRNTVTGTWLHRPNDPQGDAYNIMLPASSGTIMLDTNTYYLGRFDSDAGAKLTGATERVEMYYTARADGEGEASFDWGNTAASGQTISRNIYYSDKAFADADTASDWTQLTSFNGSGVTKSAAYTEAKNQLNNRTVGALPLTIKVTHTGGSTTDYLYYQLGVNDQDSMVGAYSVNRRLNPNYTGSAIKVRNSSGVELDIGFSGDDIDESALQTHIGSGDATVSVIYDQSGNGNDAVQSAAANQPEIASAGVIHKQNNKIVVHFLNPDTDDTLEYWLDFTNPDVYLTTYTFVGRFKHSNETSNQSYGTFTFPVYSTIRLESNGIWYRDDNYGFNAAVNLNGQVDDVAFSNATANNMGSPRWESANLFHVLTVSRDNESQTSGSYGIDGLGNERRNGLTYFAECVFYDSPLSSQIYSDINDNVNAYYSIY